MKKFMWFTVGFFSAAVLLLAIPHAPAFAIPYTSWHATFVYGPEDVKEGKKGAADMKAKFDAWKWGPDGSPKKGWETSIFPSNHVFDAYKWLRERQGENEILVFFFTGHGVTDPTDEPAADADESSTEITPPPGAPAVDKKDEGISANIDDPATPETEHNDFYDDDSGEELRDIVGFTVSIFDSCYAGGMVDGTKDINGKKKDGTNKKNETVMMASTEYTYCLRRDIAGDVIGDYTRYLIKDFPEGDPTPKTFSDWHKSAEKSHRNDYRDNPQNFLDPDKKPFFQTLQLTEYSDGAKTSRYGELRRRNALPEPAAYTLLGFGLLGIIFITRLNRREVNRGQS